MRPPLGRSIAGLGVGSLVVFLAAYLLGPLAASLASGLFTSALVWVIQRKCADLESLAHLARLDDLTGACNDRAFRERLRALGPSDTGLTLALIDVDRFKEFNDAFGHRAGDEALREVARLLAETVADAQEVYRFGGDEFAVFLSNARGAESIRRAVADHIWPLRSITVSIGLAPFQNDAPEALFDRADRALYRDKGEGGGRFVEDSPTD